MATLILTAIGTAVGGPLGGALGALAGRSIDGAIIGGGRREGPRLKELAVTTSSYGQPIARQHGRVRAAGTIVWATPLTEHKSRSGGKKGRPAVTTYAYTTSFAVALSSRPIVGLGRIWADGNLLRGAAGDLKVAGAIRVYTGEGDQRPDPLIAAAQGSACPAFRGVAYVVFDDLALEEFGNRIPALTFEVIADTGAIRMLDVLAPVAARTPGGGECAGLLGYTNDGGSLAATLEALADLFPCHVRASAGDLVVDLTDDADGGAEPLLPPPIASAGDGDFGGGSGHRLTRAAVPASRPGRLRYYDVARDYQPGVQHPAGRPGPDPAATIEFPGVLSAETARALADAMARRSASRRDRAEWRVASIDPAIVPGVAVRAPRIAGRWRVESWEWRDCGVELGLARIHRGLSAAPASDPGAAIPPVDLPLGPTLLAAFEVPPASTAVGETTMFAALSGPPAMAWSGAALFIEQNGDLLPIGAAGRSAATMARLATSLGPSPGLRFETDAVVDLIAMSAAQDYRTTTLENLLAGTNRLIVSGEVLQFLHAQPLENGVWRLSGLLRGRGGTEAAAMVGHAEGTLAVLLDDALVALDPTMVQAGSGVRVAAIGSGDAAPVEAVLANPGLGMRPPCPVHPRHRVLADGAHHFAWTRRARGGWLWSDGIDVPLVEEAERYRVGAGPVAAPFAEWVVDRPELTITADTIAAIRASTADPVLWVRQLGNHAASDAVVLARLSHQTQTGSPS